jgi:hypothetical protein
MLTLRIFFTYIVYITNAQEILIGHKWTNIRFLQPGNDKLLCDRYDELR